LIESQFRPAALPSFRARFQGITTESQSFCGEGGLMSCQREPKI